METTINYREELEKAREAVKGLKRDGCGSTIDAYWEVCCGDVLVAEAGPAILAWAIEGAVNFARNGHKLDIPAAVEEVTDTYRQRENWLDNFLDECCVREPDARVGAADLYSTYREWAAANGDYERRMTDFNAAMEAAGYQKISPKNRKTWVGIRIDQRARYSQAM